MPETANPSFRDHYGRWDAHFLRIRESTNLSAIEKEKIIEGQTKLKEVFDDAWLLENAGIGFVHPLLSQLANEVPRPQLELANLGHEIDVVKNIMGFDKLRGRLKNSREYLGAKAEVEVTAKLFAAGYANIELFPKVSIQGKPKSSDIKAGFDGEEIYFEVTTLRDSGDAAKAGHTFQELTWPYDPEIICYCQIHKILAQPRINEFKIKIQTAIAEVKQTKGYRYFGEPGVIDFLVIHPNIQKKGKVLAKRFKMKAEVTGPPLQRDDIRQLKHALREKSHQLPPDEPGIIVIFTNLIFFGSTNSFYENVVYELEDEVYDLPNLIACAVVDNVGAFGESEVYEKSHYSLRRNSNDGLVQETTLVIKNRYSDFKDSCAIKRAVDDLPVSLSDWQNKEE